MSTLELLSHLRELGVGIQLEGDKLRLRAPQGVLTADLRQRLAAHRDEILTLLRRTTDGSAPPRPIPAVRRDGPLRLSFAQQRLWFLQQLDSGSSEYNRSVALRLTGDVSAAALRSALSAVLARHEVLRSTIATGEDGVPALLPHPAARVELPVVDLSHLPGDEAWGEARRLVDADAARPFDLSTAPPLRARLIRVAHGEHVLALTVHHIASDQRSALVLRRELSHLHAACRDGRPSALPALPTQYADYAAWQRDRLAGDALHEHLDYWRTQLAGLPVLNLPADRPRTRAHARAGTHELTVPSEVVAGLRAAARRSGASMFMVLLAAFQALLSRYTGQQDIAVGIPVAGRAHPDTEPLVGFFVNTLVLRTDLSGDPTYTELLARVRRCALDAYAHQDLPFEHLVDALQPERDRTRNPLFDVLVSHQTVDTAGGAPGGLAACDFPATNTVTTFDLSLELIEAGDELHCAIEYSAQLFDPDRIERLGRHLSAVLASVAADPERRLGDLALLDPAERAELAGWSTGPTVATPARPLHELIAAQAAATPDSTAVLADGVRLGYAELEARANRLAHHLRDLGVRPESVVAALLDRGHHVPVALLGVLKAGGVYLPLATDGPPARLRFALADSAARVVLTTSDLADQVADQPRVVVLDDPAVLAALARRPVGAPAVPVHPSGGAYLMYTSGSTGTPKAVLNHHAGLVNRLLWQLDAHRLGPDDRILHKTPSTFDVSLWELCSPLLTGGTVVVATPGAHRDPAALVRLVARHAITAVDFVPSMLGPFLDAASPAECGTLRLITCGGEALPRDLVRRCHDRLGERVRVHNLYGPTETAIDVTDGRCSPDPDRSPPIGVPHSNTVCRVLDGGLRLVPVGVVGELFVGGVQVARGYAGRAGLTASWFVADPVAGDGSRVYRTGDLVRWRVGGVLEFVGRVDDQVQVRGYRVEPGEVQVALLGCVGVRAAVVVADPGGGRLVAYVVPSVGGVPWVGASTGEVASVGASAGEVASVGASAGGAVSVAALRRELGGRLPEHMIPAVFVFLPELPLTASGKVDRAALPPPDGVRPEVGARFTAPGGPVEEALAEAWQHVLELDQVGVHDNFFELGGHSLLALQVVTRARAAGIQITPAELFDHPTIAALAAVARPVTVVEDTGPLTGPLALLPIHRWWASLRLPHPEHFNQAGWFQLPGDTALLEQAAHAITHHHDALRLRATGYPDQLQLTVAADSGEPLVIEHHDCTDLAQIAERAQTSLNLVHGPIWRLDVVHRGPDQPAWVLVVVHHLAIDTISWHILTHDLALAHHQLTTGQPIDLGPHTTRIHHWAHHLTQPAAHPTPTPADPLPANPPPATPPPADPPPAEPLPVDHHTGPTTVAHSATEHLCLTPEQTDALLRRSPTAYRTQINDLLLAALTRTIHHWTGNPDLLIDLEGHGRTGPHDLSRTLGWFTTLTPTPLTSSPNPATLITTVKEQLRTTPPATTRPQILFNYHGQLDTTPGDGHDTNWRWRPTPGPTGHDVHPDTPMPHLLDVSAMVSGGQLHLHLTYPTTRYHKTTIQQLTKRLHDTLIELIDHTTHTPPGHATPSDFPLTHLTQPEIDDLTTNTPFVIDDAYPLTPMQQGMLFHTQLNPTSGVYFEHTLLTLTGPLNTHHLKHAFQHLTNRHPILRTAIHNDLQLIAKTATTPFTHHNWTHLTPDQQDHHLTQLLTDDRQQGFDLATPPLVRLTLIQHAHDRHTLIISEHHLLLDGWSLPILQDELLATYRALEADTAPRLPARRPYRDFIAWLAAQDHAENERFWRHQLDGFTTPTFLAADPPQSETGNATHHWQLSEFTTRELSRLARGRQLTFNTLVRGALAVLISQNTRSDDVCFGATVAGRPDTLPGAEHILGLFLNTLPIRIHAGPDTPLPEFLQRIQAQQIAQQPHEHTALAAIQSNSQLPPNTQLFDTLLVYQNYPSRQPDEPAPDATRICDTSTIEYDNYPLTLIAEAGARLHLTFSYDRARCAPATVRRLAGQLSAILEGFTARPDQRLGDVSALTPGERAQLTDWESGPVRALSAEPVHQLIGAQAARTPHATAVVAGDQKLSYAELDQRANRLAHHLCGRGVGPEAVVAVLLPRGIDLVVAFLAVLKAGGAYLPLDPADPPERLAFMVEDSRAQLVLTTGTLDGLDLGSLPNTPPPVEAHPHGAAYLIYTSGSTGAPKAVVVTHGGLSNHDHAITELFGIGPHTRALQAFLPSFDAAAEELYPVLSHGGTLHVATDGWPDASRFGDVAHQAGLTMLHLPAAYWTSWTASATPTRHGLAGVRVAKIGGERPRPADIRRWYDEVDIPLWNVYGPTEATITITACPLDRKLPDSVAPPIGTPLANTSCLVLDGRLRRVPVGAVGELYLGGVQLARGYAGRAALTAERFVANPFGTGERLYRTGDLARWRDDGQLEFIGRIDHQLKLHGHRIEPAEIESALLTHPRVESAVVTVAAGPLLTAHLVATGTPPSIADLRAQLAARLPAYLVPAAFVVLDALPLTPSGKLDRRALPAPDLAATARYQEPRTPTERWLAELWRDVLRAERAGAHDDFFELGGHSLLATQIAAQVRAHFEVDLPVAAVFDNPTLTALAAAIDGLSRTHPLPPIEPGAGRPVLSFAQQRLWFLHLLEPGSTEYHVPTALRLTGPLDADALGRAVGEVFTRHDVLRTVVEVDAGGAPVPTVRPAAPSALEVTDLSGLPAADAAARARELVDADAARPFDLAAEWPLRVRLIRLAEHEHVLALVGHHIAFDEWSQEILHRELTALYAAFRDGRPSPLPPLPVRYADYAAWQSRWLSGPELERQLGYWRARLADLPTLDLPTDRPRPLVRDPAGAMHRFLVPAGVAAGVRAVARRGRASAFMALLAAFQVVLGRYAGQRDVAVGTPVANRAHPDTADLIGFFVNTLVLRADLSGDPSFAELLARVRASALDAYAHQDLPFERLVDELRPQRDRSRNPLFQVMFTHTTAGPDDGAPGLATQQCGFPVGYAATQFDLTLNLVDAGEHGLLGTVEYSTGLFDHPTVERLSAQLCALLEAVAADPDRPLSALPSLPEAERAQLAGWSTGPGLEVPARPVHEQVTEHAARAPARTAVVADGVQLSYAELEARANRLAHHLRALGIGREAVVAVLLPRTAELMVAILAVLKAGAAYLPLDPDVPEARLHWQLADSRARLLITGRDPATAPTNAPVPTLAPDDPGLDGQPDTPPAVRPHPDNGAYLIYTSGSTGRPKASVGTHRNLTQLLHAWTHTHGLDHTHRWLTTANPAFDAFTLDWLRAIGPGAALHLGPDRRHLDPAELAGLLTARRVTAFETTPHQLDALLPHLPQPALPDLRLAVVASTLWSATDHRRARRVLPHARLLTAYGLTETAVDTTTHTTTDDPAATQPVGVPLPHSTVHLLDPATLQPVPIGATGEIHIGGAGITRGYADQPALTANRFIANPYNTGQRLYRTGDLAHWDPNGQLHLHGRTDQQINLHGHRIEPTEIETALRAHQHVTAAHVTATGEPARLVAYLTLGRTAAPPPTVTDLRAFLAGRLPQPMIPAVFVFLPELPLTTSGKVDRAALPAPDGSRPDLGRVFAAPSGEVERVLAEVWQRVLRVDQVGAHDDFFELGGDSILSIQVVTRARAAGLAVTPAELFDHPTVAGLAAVARPAGTVTAGDGGPAEGPVRLTPIHRWWAAQRLPHPEHFNQATLFALPAAAPVAVDVLDRAAAAVAARHDALRLRARGYPDELSLEVVADPGGPLVTEHHLTGSCLADEHAGLARIAEAAQAGLNLTDGPIWRLELVHRPGGEPPWVLVVVHHLAIDTVSWHILTDDLSLAHHQLARGLPVDLGSRGTSLRAWADHLADRPAPASAGEGDDPLPVDGDPLPVDHDGGPGTLAEAATEDLCLTPALTSALLRQSPAAYRTQVNDLLLAALALAVHRWSGARRVLVEVEGQGRTHTGPHDLSRTVGWFTTLTPALLALPPDPADPAALITGVKEQLRAAPSGAGTRPEIGFNYHGRLDLPTDDRTPVGDTPVGGTPVSDTPASDSPVSDTSASDTPGDGDPDGGWMWRPVPGPTGSELHPDTPMAHLLEVTAGVSDGRLHVVLTYPTTRFLAPTVRRLGGLLHESLVELVEHTSSTPPGRATPSDFPLARLGQAEVDELTGGSPFVVEAAYPLSPMQSGMLFHSLLDPHGGTYFEHTLLTFDGRLDAGLLRDAFQRLVDRHPILRTAIRHDLPEPVQVVAAAATIPFTEHDWTGLAPGQQERALERLLEQDRRRGFDLASPPLARLALVRHEECRATLVVAAHHVLLDGWSLPMLQAELLAAYHALAAGSVPRLPARRPYRDFIAWLTEQDRDADEEFWRRQLDGFTGPTWLATGPPQPVTGHATHHWQLSEASTRALTEFARGHQLTLSTVLRGALAVLVGRHTGSDDVCYGATVAGRPADLPGAEDMLGLFLNTLPVRTRIDPGAPVLDFLRALQAQQLAQQPHEHTPLTTIQAVSPLPPNTPLFDALLVVHNYPVTDLEAPSGGGPGSGGPGGGAAVCGISAEEAHDHYPLTFTAIPDGSLQLTIAYDRARMAPSTVLRLADHLSAALESFVADPHRTLGEISLLSEPERALVSGWASGPVVPVGALVPEAIAAQVAATPDAVAVVAGEQQLTYRGLWRRATRLAHWLHHRGVGPEVVVAVQLPRGLDLVVALLGIWQAGGVYLPIDPDHPTARRDLLLRNSRTHLTLTDLPEDLPDHPSTPPPIRTRPQNAAYLLYTSGSTGTPKGVLTHHAGLANRIHWQTHTQQLGPSDRILHKTPTTFDVSLWELCCPLITGGTLVLAPPGQHRDPTALNTLVRHHQITAIHFVPTLLGPFLQATTAEDTTSLRLLVTSGEALTTTLAHHCLTTLPHTELHNLYGPTEATIDITAAQITTTDRTPPIGAPVHNSTCHVLDPHLHPTPIGIIGDLYLGGIQLARGYHHQPALTATTFTPDPLSTNGSRLYRTGDLATWTPDGQLTYHGRTDHQLKIRGQRTEPTEIENTLLTHPLITAATITTHPDHHGDPRLVAYLTTTTHTEPTELRAHLAARLPEHMIPTVFVVLPELPHTTSGKIDHKALPAPDFGRPALSTEFVEPSGVTEEALAEIWRQVLGVDRVGRNDHFFELGGHSLLALQVVSRITSRLGLGLSLATVFNTPRLADQAAAVERALIERIERLSDDEVSGLLSPEGNA